MQQVFCWVKWLEYIAGYQTAAGASADVASAAYESQMNCICSAADCFAVPLCWSTLVPKKKTPARRQRCAGHPDSASQRHVPFGHVMFAWMWRVFEKDEENDQAQPARGPVTCEEGIPLPAGKMGPMIRDSDASENIWAMWEQMTSSLKHALGCRRDNSPSLRRPCCEVNLHWWGQKKETFLHICFSLITKHGSRTGSCGGFPPTTTEF